MLFRSSVAPAALALRLGERTLLVLCTCPVWQNNHHFNKNLPSPPSCSTLIRPPLCYLQLRFVPEIRLIFHLPKASLLLTPLSLILIPSPRYPAYPFALSTLPSSLYFSFSSTPPIHSIRLTLIVSADISPSTLLMELTLLLGIVRSALD